MAVSVAEMMRHVNNYFERACGNTLAADAPYGAIEGLGVFAREELEAMQAKPPEGGAIAPTRAADSGIAAPQARSLRLNETQAESEGGAIAPTRAADSGIAAPQARSLRLAEAQVTGRVWSCYPPPDFLALCREIEAYAEAHPVGAPRSESFGAYRYEGGGEGWETAFAARLAPYRRMFTEVKV